MKFIKISPLPISCHWPLSIPPENIWCRKGPVVGNGLTRLVELTRKCLVSTKKTHILKQGLFKYV